MAHIFQWEGGYIDMPRAPGGAVKYGIARQALADWREKSSIPKQELIELSRQEAADIYAARYWRRFRGDQLPGCIAFLVMDACVVSGLSVAVRTLQRSCNILGAALKEDGLTGPRTLGAVSQLDTGLLLNEFVVRRGVQLGARKTISDRSLGWARRLVAAAREANTLFLQDKTQADALESLAPGAPSRKPTFDWRAALPTDLTLERYFYNDRGVQVFGSFFRLWDGWATAAHVMEQMLGTAPPFTEGPMLIRPAGLDAALIGCTLPDTPPPAPTRGQKLVAAGFPAGSLTPSLRTAEVYLQRPTTQDWIATISTPPEPVVVGMSGGAVCDASTGRILGVMITRNSPADTDMDGVMEQNFDFVALYDIWHAARASTVRV